MEKENKFSNSFYIDVKDSLSKQLNVKIVPTTFILSEDGYVIYKNVGLTNFEEFKKALIVLNVLPKEDTNEK